jgi:hypothetical protein
VVILYYLTVILLIGRPNDHELHCVDQYELHVKVRRIEVFHVILLSYYQQRDSQRSKAQVVFVIAILRGGM